MAQCLLICFSLVDRAIGFRGWVPSIFDVSACPDVIGALPLIKSQLINPLELESFTTRSL